MNANEWAEFHKLSIEVMRLIEKDRQQHADLKDADKYALELERLYEDAKAEIEALKADKALHDEAYLSQMKEIEALKEKLDEAEQRYWNNK